MTDQTIEVLRNNLREKIAEHGFTKIGVFDSEGTDTPYMYTVGLSQAQDGKPELPELIVAARLEYETLNDFLDWFAHYYRENGWSLHTYEYAFELEEGGYFSIRTVEVDPHYALEHFLKQAEPILQRHVFRVAQLQISDAYGRWPDEPEFDNKFQQPFIGAILAK